MSTALTVSIKAQQPVNKLSLSQSAVWRSGPCSSSAAHSQAPQGGHNPCWSEKATLMSWFGLYHGAADWPAWLLEEATIQMGVQPVHSPFGLEGQWHFVFAPLMQLEPRPR